MRAPKGFRNNARPDWFRIQAKEDHAEVMIYGDIGESFWDDSVPAAQFVRDLAEIDDALPIDFHIHSPGGDVFDGLAIATAIRNHPARTVAYVDGLAASAASFIAVAADETVMAQGAQLMVHDAWGFAMGNAADMTKMAEDLGKVSDNIAAQYAAKAGGEVSDWRDVMLAETWYTADEAVEAGLADRVDTKKKADTKNAFDLSIFAHAGRENAPAPKPITHIPPAEPAENQPTTPEGADMPSDTLILGLRERLGVKAEAELDEAGLLTAIDEALSERSEPQPPKTVVTHEPLAGTVMVEQGVFDQLRADAEAGRAARNQQLADYRAAVVDNAIATGRISPARRDDWLNTLKADPGSEATLNGLAAGLVPLASSGYAGGVEESNDDDKEIDAWVASVTSRGSI